MNRRVRKGLLLIAVFAAIGIKPVSALGPSFIIVYGDSVPKPTVLRLGHEADDCGFLWDTIARGGTTFLNGTMQHGRIPDGLSGRPYLNVAIFWGTPFDPAAKPEDASQHARFYPPTATKPAVVVATVPTMDEPEPRPVPQDLDEHRDALGHQTGFVAGWTVTVGDAQRLGIVP